MFEMNTRVPATTNRVDEDLSVLLQSIEIDSSKQGLPRRAPRPPYARSASARPLGPAQTAAVPRVVAKTQSVDSVVRDRLVDIVAGAMMGIVVASVLVLILQSQAS